MGIELSIECSKSKTDCQIRLQTIESNT